MAKKEKIEEAVVIGDTGEILNQAEETQEAPAQEVKPVQAAKPQAVKVVPRTVKKVRIRTATEVDSLINQVRYSFPKGKETEVPDDVAAILCYGEKAYRI